MKLAGAQTSAAAGRRLAGTFHVVVLAIVTRVLVILLSAPVAFHVQSLRFRLQTGAISKALWLNTAATACQAAASRGLFVCAQ